MLSPSSPRVAAAVLAVVAALGGSVHADDGDYQYVGQVESMELPGEGLIPHVFGADPQAAASSARQPPNCTPTTTKMSTSTKLVGYVYYDFARGAIKVDWSTPTDSAGRPGGGTAEVSRVSSTCQLVVDARTKLIDSSFFCVKQNENGEIADYENEERVNSSTTRKTTVPGKLLGVPYVQPGGIGVPCYRLSAYVQIQFHAGWRTTAGSGPVGTGCLSREWKVTFAPHNVTLDPSSLSPGIEWLSIGPATAEKPCS